MKRNIIKVFGLSTIFVVPFSYCVVNADTNIDSIIDDSSICINEDVDYPYIHEETSEIYCSNSLNSVNRESIVSNLKLETVNGILRITDSEGNFYVGMQEIDGKIYYADEHAIVVKDKFFVYNGRAYITGENGQILEGVVYSKEYKAYYYCNPAEAGAISVKAGFVDWNGNKYYVGGRGPLVLDKFFVHDGRAYITGEDGRVLEGVVYSKEYKAYYYCNPAEAGAISVKAGFVDWNGNKYYVGGRGPLVLDKFFVHDGRAYITGEDGRVLEGVVYSKEYKAYYYCNPAEAGAISVKASFVDWNGNKYYVGGRGPLVLDKFFVHDGRAYITGEDGRVLEGVVYSKEYKAYYYCNPAEAGAISVRIGLIEWNGTKYYITKGGPIARNLCVEINGKTYYMGNDCKVCTGVVYCKDRHCYYYCDPADGGAVRMTEGDIVWNGQTYHINKDGRIGSEIEIKAADLAESLGWSVFNAYKYLAKQPYYRMYVDPKDGKEWFANFGFTNGKGNCYVKTAMLYYMMKSMGYDNIRAVDGYCMGYRGERLPHGWIEFYENGKTYIIDPTFENEVGRNGYMIEYGQKGTWKYIPKESRTWAE